MALTIDNSSYWRSRREQMQSAAEKDEAKLNSKLQQYYREESARLGKEIDHYYAKYGVDNVIQYRTLLSALPASERDLLIRDIDAFAQKWPQWSHLVPTRKSIYKLDRLEGLQTSVKLHMLETGAATEQEVGEHLSRLALRGSNMAAEVMGYGENFYSIDDAAVRSIVVNPWTGGGNYSARIWQNIDQLTAMLNTDIAQGIVRGDSNAVLEKAIRDKFEYVSAYQAKRLIYTEDTYVMAESTIRPLEKDFDKYSLLTAGDSKVCEICGGLEGEIFKITERQPGENFPPLHPWCRCTWEIAVEDWNKWLDEYAAKHGEGSIALEKDSFERARFIHAESDLMNVSKSSIIEKKTHSEITEHFKREHNIIIKDFENKELLAVKSPLVGYDDMLNEFPELKGSIKEIRYNYHISANGDINLKTGISQVGKSGLFDYGTGVHEAAHMLDHIRSSIQGRDYAAETVETARKNLGLRKNSKQYTEQVYGMVGIVKDKNTYKDPKELFAYGMETAKGRVKNSFAMEIYRLAKEG